MLVVTRTLTELTDKALQDLAAPDELGLRVSIGSSALSTADTVNLTLSDASGVNVSDIIEFGDELVLVTGKSTDSTPVLTVARGYYNTPKSPQPGGTVGLVNPQFPRIRIQEGVRRALSRLEALGVPLVTTVTLNSFEDKRFADLPADCREVLRVAYVDTDGRVAELSGWRMFDDMPTDKFPSGKALRIPYLVADTDDLEVTYRKPYRWSSHPDEPAGTDTVTLPEGAEDLPALYAAAWLVSRREVSRAQIDRASEWNASEPQRGGVSRGLVRDLWQEFYQALDQAKRLYQAPVTRPYIRMPKL